MTKATKPMARETEVTIRSLGKPRPIIVGLTHGGMVVTFRLKQHRQTYSLPLDWCFWQAVEAHIHAEKRAKRAARTARRASR